MQLMTSFPDLMLPGVVGTGGGRRLSVPPLLPPPSTVNLPHSQRGPLAAAQPAVGRRGLRSASGGCALARLRGRRLLRRSAAGRAGRATEGLLQCDDDAKRRRTRALRPTAASASLVAVASGG